MRRYFEIILLMTADSLRYQKVSVILKSVIHTSDRKHNFYDSPYLLYYADCSITEIKKQIYKDMLEIDAIFRSYKGILKRLM